MAQVKNFEGLMVAPCTPFNDNGDVNLDVIEQYLQHILDYGVKNLFVTGTIGEGNSMTVQERKQVAAKWIELGKGRMSAIVIHVGAGNLRDTQELARHAQEIGADGIACVSPTYYKPETVESYVHYMKAVAEAAPKLAFLLYDIDFVTGVKFDLNEFYNIARNEIPTLRGMKHTTPSLPSMNTLLMNHGQYQILMGTADTYLAGLAIGLPGNVIESYFGPLMVRIKKAFDAGDLKTARMEQNRALILRHTINKYELSIPGTCKAFLRALGIEVGNPRLPLLSVPQSVVDSLRKDLQQIGFFEWGAKI